MEIRIVAESSQSSCHWVREGVDPHAMDFIDGHTSNLMVRHFVVWQGAGGQYVRAVVLLTTLAEVNDN